jgi:hypothetical protein
MKTANAQDFHKTVVPLTELKFLGIGLEAKFGTGFCLDPACRFIGTNYHVAMMAQLHKIKGERVVNRYLATSADDEGATLNNAIAGGPMRYKFNRDLAILELRYPLSKHHGVAFSLDELQKGQAVDIYTYPKEGINPFRKLLQFQATFIGETQDGLLAFNYAFSGEKSIRPGASGGIVVDKKTQQIVGILNSIALNGDAVAMAVPIQSLLDFVSKVDPYLAKSLFPAAKITSPVSADIYPKFVPPPPTAGLQHRPEEPAEVRLLRSKAQFIADSMRNFIAVQSFAWGSGNKEPSALAAYEVRVVDGDQRYREYPEGQKEFERVPFPHLNDWALPANEWSELPKMVGTEIRLKVREADDVVVNDKPMKVFQYYASVEDNLCPFDPIDDYGFFKISKVVAVACYGEVWTDEETNILRISEHLELSEKLKAYRGWEGYQVVLTYGWLKRMNQASWLVPLTIFTEGINNKHSYWCRGRFTDYKVFDSKFKIVPGAPQLNAQTRGSN